MQKENIKRVIFDTYMAIYKLFLWPWKVNRRSCVWFAQVPKRPKKKTVRELGRKNGGPLKSTVQIVNVPKDQFPNMDAGLYLWIGFIQMCPRNLNLFGPFGVFMGLLMPLRVSMTVYLSHLEFFCPRLSLKGTLFIPIVSNQMIKIRREIIQRPKTAKCVKLIIFS